MSASPPAAKKPPSQIIKNVLVNWFGFMVTVLTGFWMSPFLIHHLGEAEYGVWVLTGSLVGYLGLLDFGVTQSTVKYIAEYRAKDDQDAINRVVTGGVSVFSILGSLVVVGSCILGLVFNRFFHTHVPDATAALVVFLVGLNLAITFPASVFLGVLRGYQRYDIGATAMSFSILARSGFIWWAVSHGYGLVAVSGISLFFDVIRLAYVIYRVFDINPNIRVGKAYFRRHELRRLFGHSVWVFAIMVGDQVNYYTDSVVIGLFLPPVAITIYFIAFRLVGYLRLFVVEMVGVLMPAVSSLHANEDAKKVADLLTMGSKFTMLLALPPSIVFFLLGDRFISLWMGKDYAQSAQLLSILTIGIIVHLSEMTITTVLVGMGRASIVARFALAQSGLNLVLSLLLIKPFGLIGVALGTTISMAGFVLVTIPVYFKHYLKFSLNDFVRRAFLPPLLAQVPWLLALLAIRNFIPLNSLGVFFGTLLVAMVPYGVFVFMTCLSENEKKAFSSLTGRFGFKPQTG